VCDNFPRQFHFLVHLDQRRSRWTIAITWRPSSVVCCLLSVNFSHFKLLLRFQWSFIYSLGSVSSLVSEKKIFEISANQSTLLALAAILNIRLERKTVTFSLKLLGQLKPNCPGMIIGRSSTNYMFFMPIGNPRWPPPQYMDWHWTLWENVQMPSSQKLQILQFGFNHICSFWEEGIWTFSHRVQC
jgi:hypothetical protein